MVKIPTDNYVELVAQCVNKSRMGMSPPTCQPVPRVVEGQAGDPLFADAESLGKMGLATELFKITSLPMCCLLEPSVGALPCATSFKTSPHLQGFEGRQLQQLKHPAGVPHGQDARGAVQIARRYLEVWNEGRGERLEVMGVQWSGQRASEGIRDREVQ